MWVKVLTCWTNFVSSTALCSLNMHTYSFPAPCCDFTSRVARSIHTIRHPVTLGSRVPLCPVFSTLNILFTQATTSCEDGLDGLSKFMTPLLKYSMRGEHDARQFEPSHEIMVLFAPRKLILQTCMCSHPVGLDV